MPRPIPAAFAAIDPQTLLTGEKLLADTLDDLGAASNWLDAYAALVAPVIAQRKAAERSSIGRLWHETKGVLQKVFGPRHLVWKAGAALAVLSVALLVLVPVAVYVFKDRISWVNISGIFVCLAGLVMLNWKR